MTSQSLQIPNEVVRDRWRSSLMRQGDSNTCSQCQASGLGLIQCECCDLWYCNVCCEISDEAFTLLTEAECLHFFCSSCEGKVFNLINKKSLDVSTAAGSQSNLLSAVTDTISISINNLQTAM